MKIDLKIKYFNIQITQPKSNMVNFKEIEYKYEAKNIQLSVFESYINELNPKNIITVSSYDEYYNSNSSNSVDFIRYRYNNNFKELTVKKKMIETNNNNRIEINIELCDKNNLKIKTFLELIGYNFNFKIYKTSNIYEFDDVVISYYIVYSDDMMELGRFIEIEANEEYPFKTEYQAFETINKYEKLFDNVGISYRRRLKKSLFEMFSN